jgi:hypothetical protein
MVEKVTKPFRKENAMFMISVNAIGAPEITDIICPSSLRGGREAIVELLAEVPDWMLGIFIDTADIVVLS